MPVHLPRERADANGDGWLTVAWVLERGHVAVLASSEVRFKSNPLVALARDDGPGRERNRARRWTPVGARAGNVRSEDGMVAVLAVDGGAADQNVVRGVASDSATSSPPEWLASARRITTPPTTRSRTRCCYRRTTLDNARVCRLDCSTRSVLAKTETSSPCGWDGEVERRESGRKRHHSGETRLYDRQSARDARRKVRHREKGSESGSGTATFAIHRRS